MFFGFCFLPSDSREYIPYYTSDRLFFCCWCVCVGVFFVFCFLPLDSRNTIPGILFFGQVGFVVVYVCAGVFFFVFPPVRQ